MNLADPDLELIDPTPNVHSMFLHFDKTFFWTKLSSRCVVRWSKRMYSCAGICSYEGRGGLCDIALSEPLLKLRPRKDLVETLLHEMIHAFLFITRKDQDRDGHGPNFQAHMHRINRAAGLNISIYHDFHDEVKLYQTHWWRCNGPCQSKRPHFGIVRRTCNRAPGPSDYWWNAHQRSCGGTFIKIKEPQKPTKETNSKKPKANPNADITKYINNNNSDVKNKNSINTNKPNNVKPILKDTSNVPVKTNTSKTNVGIKSNNGSTLVVNKKNVIYNPVVNKPKTVVFSGTGHTINTKDIISRSNDVLETVRNVWINKQLSNNSNINSRSNTNTSSQSKQKAETEHTDSPPSKIKKINDYFKTTATSVLKDLYGQDFNLTQTKSNEKLIAVAKVPKETDLVICPVCNSKIKSSDINRHLDECLNKSVIDDLSKELPENKDSGLNNEIIVRNKINEIVDTVLPGSIFKEETVIKNIKNENVGTIDLTNVGLLNGDKHKRPIGRDETVEIVSVDSSMKIEPGCSKTEIESDKECPCCGDKLNSTVDEHLEECLSFFENNTTIPDEGASTSFNNETIVIDDECDEFDETLTMNATGTKLPCPVCLKMVEEIEMNNHLDKCLN